MTTRSSNRRFTPRAPRVLGGLLGAVSVVFALSVAAQPAVKDAGAPSKDAGVTTAPAIDAGAVAPPAGDGGVTGPDSIVGDASSNVPQLRKTAPPLPRPTPQQVAAYEAMKAEADIYEKGARDYKDTMTAIITLHYEQKKKLILSGLDKEIRIESEELEKARDLAIKRLEEFIAKYSGENAHPEATPDAMYRLAALYEEKARNKELEIPLDKSTYMNDAVNLYKRVINEFPKYKELAGIYYFLGHALSAQQKKDESQAVWRALVCQKSASMGGYVYPLGYDPKDIGVDKPLKQNNVADYWNKWRSVHWKPESIPHSTKAGVPGKPVAPPKKGAPSNDADTRYVEVYPTDCVAVPQPNLRPGEDQKYVAEIWWQIGNWEFENDDLGGGVVDGFPYAAFDFNRAASAYSNSMRVSGKTSIIYGVSLYKYAWTLFKQERYEAAVRAFVSLLLYTDELEKLGQQVADFRQEAYTYIAGSLMTSDFTGPPPEDPYTMHDDIIASDPKKAEKELVIAFTRVKDKELVPQDKTWTIDIYRALAAEYRAVNHYQSALNVYREIIKRWGACDPKQCTANGVSLCDPQMPDVQNAIAETYEQWAKAQQVGSAERTLYETETLKARTELANYVGDKPWVDCNKENPAALQHAEEIVRFGLRAAAEKHTGNGQSYYDEAQKAAERQDKGKTIEWLTRAQEEYKLAALGWRGYLSQDENAPDSYRSRFLLADALRWRVRIQVDLHGIDGKTYPEPATADITAARAAAIEVRDSDEDDQYLDDAATYVVDLSDVGRDLAYTRFDQSGGSSGIEKHEYPKFPKLAGPEGAQQVVVEVIPAEVQASMQARDDYVQRVPPEKDKQNPPRGLGFLLYSAEAFFVYGHFKEARERYEPIYRDHCGKDPSGYQAWSRLISMSNMENDKDRSLQLAQAAQAKSCAIINGKVDEKLKADEDALAKGSIIQASFDKARKAFDAAQQAEKDNKPAADIQKLYAQAAGMYESALQAEPSNARAPEAAINAAYSYKKIGNTAKAIEMYRLFIDKYGSEDILKKLEGDKKSKGGGAAKENPYDERVGYLLQAWEALSSTYYSFFDYRRAAESYSKIALNKRFPAARRQNAARNAMVIYANIGDRANMLVQYGVLISPEFNLPADKRVEADFNKANFDYSQWDINGPDTGSNAANRRVAQTSMSDFHQKNQANGPAARFALEAAYKIARMLKSIGDATYHDWMKKTISSWEFFKSHPFDVMDTEGKKTGSITADEWPYVDWVSECEYTLVDEEIKKDFDYDSSNTHSHYGGAIDDVKTAYTKDFEAAEKKWRPKLERIATQYKSKAWIPAITARIGSLYDTLRTGLDNAPFNLPKMLKLANGKTINLDQLIKQMEANQQFDQADQLRDVARTEWRKFKDGELDVLNAKMIGRYAIAAQMAKINYVKDATVQKAVGRLAFFTDYLGDDKMGPYVEAADDPANPGSKMKYTKGMFLQWRAGQVQHPKPSGAAVPPPVAP